MEIENFNNSDIEKIKTFLLDKLTDVIYITRHSPVVVIRKTVSYTFLDTIHKQIEIYIEKENIDTLYSLAQSMGFTIYKENL
jgi:hypothetical protein